jgi:uncharacterized RDD family membrane protein YckC
MRLSCPHCGCAREIDDDLVPPGAERFLCPGCGEVFERQPLAAAGAAGVGTAERCVAVAGFWLRGAALLIDLIVLGLLQFGCGLLFFLLATWLAAPADTRSWLLVGVGTWGMVLSIALAYGVVFVANGGQTPGKMALRLRVIRCDGSAVGLARALRRELPGKLLSVLTCGAGFLQVAFDPRKQALHDRLAQTYVIKL